MFKKIIAALDTSVMSKYVFDNALALAKMTGANLRLLYVFVEEDEGLVYPKLETLEQYPGVPGEAVRCYKGHLNLEHLNAVDNPGLHLLQYRTHKATATGVDSEANLNRAILRRAIVIGTNFSYADLTETDRTETDFSQANLYQAKL